MSQSKNLIEQTRRSIEQQMIRENAPSPTLQNLPANLKHSIVGMLNCKNATSLASTSKQWGRNVQTQLATRKPVKFYYVKYKDFGVTYKYNKGPGTAYTNTHTRILLYDDPRVAILQELGAKRGIQIPASYYTRYNNIIKKNDTPFYKVSKMLLFFLGGVEEFMSISKFNKKYKYAPTLNVGTFKIQEVPEFNCFSNSYGITSYYDMTYQNEREFERDWDVYNNDNYFEMLKKLSPKSIQMLVQKYNSPIPFNNNAWREYDWDNMYQYNQVGRYNTSGSNHNGSNSNNN